MSIMKITGPYVIQHAHQHLLLFGTFQNVQVEEIVKISCVIYSLRNFAENIFKDQIKHHNSLPIDLAKKMDLWCCFLVEGATSQYNYFNTTDHHDNMTIH